MTRPFTLHCRELRDRARAEAEQYLKTVGFTGRKEGGWRGALRGPADEAEEVTVQLPDGFPDCLPEVSVPPGQTPRARAHVGPRGSLCIAPEGGALIDTRCGGRIVRDTLERAKQVLFSDEASRRRDTELEFGSYWMATPGYQVLSLVPGGHDTAETWVAKVDHPEYRYVVAISEDKLRRWVTGWKPEAAAVFRGYHVRLRRLPVPPGYGEPVTLGRLYEMVAADGGQPLATGLGRWLSRQKLPALLTVSAPIAHRQEDAVFAALVPRPTGDALKRAEKGFRPGKAPRAWVAVNARQEPIERPPLNRADPDYTVPRGGGALTLAGKKVVVIGCGAVGSHLASLLASSGVGKLFLVDHETLSTANLFRHLLGAESLGQQKALAVRNTLQQRFPDLEVDARAVTAQDFLDQYPQQLSDADLVAVALGDETLELRLNEFLRRRLSRVHVWLEPLGLGGHVLACGPDGTPGCLACLYRPDDVAGFVNMASLVAPGQTFQRAIGGCAGTFTPYGVVDAVRAAEEATREIVRRLTGGGAPRLISWMTDRSAFEAAGHVVSARAATLSVGGTVVHEQFARPDCPVCGGRQG